MSTLVNDLPIETCRECRDEMAYGSKLPAAVFILWGKLFPQEALGPKCMDHARKWFDVFRADQYAVFDLRRIDALLTATHDAALEELDVMAAEAWAIRNEFVAFWGAHSSQQLGELMEASPRMPKTPVLDMWHPRDGSPAIRAAKEVTP